MMTALAVPPAPTITPEQLDLIKRTIAKDATPIELDLFLYDNARRGLHPLDRLIHFTKRGGKYTPVTSIDLMRARAAATGEYAGQEDALFLNIPLGPGFSATVTVYRLVQGQRCPFTATARWLEYKPDQDFMWRKMPHTMLGKCAEALALRKAFPQELSGLYEAAELAQSDNVDRATGELIEGPKPATNAQRLFDGAAAVGPDPRSVGLKISAQQRKRLFAIATKAGWTRGQVKEALKQKFNLDSTSAIETKQYHDVCAAFEETPPRPGPDEPF